MTQGNRKTAVVVGASGGIGAAIARALAGDGYFVHGFYNSNRERLENALEGLERGSFSISGLDVRDERAVAGRFQEVIDARAAVDTLVYSVTPPIPNKSVLDLKWESFQDHLDIHVRGLFWIVQGLKRQLLAKHRTRIVVISTDYCVGAPPSSVSHYVTGKQALAGFAKALAVDLARFNCTVNLVTPGMVQTKLLDPLPPKLVEITASSNPLKRLASPQDVAAVARFLASDGADYLNGANITVNGGRTML